MTSALAHHVALLVAAKLWMEHDRQHSLDAILTVIVRARQLSADSVQPSDDGRGYVLGF